MFFYEFLSRSKKNYKFVIKLKSCISAIYFIFNFEEKCSLCSIYYYNSLENIWADGDHFPLDQCLPKKIDVLNLTIFVSLKKLAMKIIIVMDFYFPF